MCNGLGDYIEINESVVGKIPVSEWPTVLCFMVWTSVLGGSFRFVKTKQQMGYIHIRGFFYYIQLYNFIWTGLQRISMVLLH